MSYTVYFVALFLQSILCPFCMENEGGEKNFMAHIRLEHKENINYSVKCPALHCGRGFQDVQRYKKHYIKAHSEELPGPSKKV